MAKAKSSGLGAAAFFAPPPAAPAASLPTPISPPVPPPAAAEPAPPPLPARSRTTITLYAETLALLEALKIDAKRRSQKATFSDILAEAIHDLARKKKVSL